MAVIFMDGLDGDDPEPGKWVDFGGASITTADPRTGSRCFNCEGSVGAYVLLGDDADAELIVAGAYRWNGNTGSTEGSTGGLMQLWGDNHTVRHLTLTQSAAGFLSVRRGRGDDTILATATSGALIEDVYAFVEFRAVLSDTVGEIQVRVNGVEVINETGIDTKNGGTGDEFDAVSIEICRSKVDDFFILNSTDATATQGVPNNDFLGDSRVNLLLPDGDSTPSEWTPSTGSDSFAVTDEVPPNTSDWIAADTAADVDMMTFDDLTDTDHVVYAAQVVGYAAKDDAGGRAYRHRIDSDSNVETFDDHVLSTDYATFYDILGADPDGDVQWTPAQINALTAGVEVRDL